jgi:hypothetical protein
VLEEDVGDRGESFRPEVVPSDGSSPSFLAMTRGLPDLFIRRQERE